MSAVERLWRRQGLGMELSRKMGGFGMKMEICVVVLLPWVQVQQENREEDFG
jgi:hypothetical protein